MLIARPARRWISSALRLRTSQVPPPTVPMPSRPTLIGFMSHQASFEVAFDVGPLGGEHAVHDAVSHRAVAPRPMVAYDAVLLCAQRLDGALGGEVEVVGAQPDHFAFQRFESVREQQELAGRIDMAALEPLRIPGIADLDAVGGGDDVVIAGTTDDLSRRGLANHPWEHVAVLLPLQRGFDVLRRLAGRRNAGEPQLPELAVLRGCLETFLVLLLHGFEPNAMALERHGLRSDHAAPRRRPSFLNMSLMPRTAWRKRCSFSMSAMRTWSSP